MDFSYASSFTIVKKPANYSEKKSASRCMRNQQDQQVDETNEKDQSDREENKNECWAQESMNSDAAPDWKITASSTPRD